MLHGSARLTRDLDIVLATDEANLRALGKVLIDLNARPRGVDEDVGSCPTSGRFGRFNCSIEELEAIKLLRRKLGRTWVPSAT